MDLEYEKKQFILYRKYPSNGPTTQIQKFILGNQPFYDVTIYRQTWTTAAVKQ